MRIGFLGTGVITKAVVTGLLKTDMTIDMIAISSRNAEVAQFLASQDSRIHICKNNQEVLDLSDIVCIAVIPQITADVLQTLTFRQDHKVISFVPGFSQVQLADLIKPAKEITRAIPLPAVADLKGCTAVYPANQSATPIFSRLGTVVEVDAEIQFNALHSVTATMASYYAVLESQALWLVKQGVNYSSARAFLAGYYDGLTHDIKQTDLSFSEMISYLMTPGGLNEQLHAELTAHDAYSHYGVALDKILERVK